jgi:hypothetical protein
MSVEIGQNPKDPLWIVTVQTLMSSRPDTHGPEHTITAHGPDAATAKAYVEQQNPGCMIVGVEKAK